MSFKVKILGSGSAVPTLRRNSTSQLLQVSSRYILIDCGEGTQIQMRKFGAKFQKIDIVLISHLHGDHYLGLFGLLSTMHLLGRVKPILIFAPEGLKEIVELHMKYGHAHFGYDLIFREISPNTRELLYEDPKIEIRCFPLVHKIPTHGFAIKEKQKDPKLLKEKVEADSIKVEYYHLLKKGLDIETESGEIIHAKEYTVPSPPSKTYAFCSDTAFYPDLIKDIRSVDLLYHEATFTAKYADRAKATKHSTAAQAAEIASQAAVKNLIIGHFSARFDSGEEHLKEAVKVFPQTRLAEDGDEFKL